MRIYSATRQRSGQTEEQRDARDAIRESLEQLLMKTARIKERKCNQRQRLSSFLYKRHSRQHHHRLHHLCLIGGENKSGFALKDCVSCDSLSAMILNTSDLGWDESSGAESFFPLDLLDRSPKYEVPPLTVWGVALCVSGTLIAAENAIVVTTILATPSLRAPVFLLLASLGLADLLAGVALILHFLFLFCVEPSDWSELLTSGLLVTSLTASLCSLMGVALDRYLSLSQALTYGSSQSRHRAAILLLLVWLGACIIGAGPAMGWHCLEEPNSCSVARPLTRTYLSLLCGGFLVVVMITLQLYAGICRVARRHAHAIATQRHFLPANQSYASKHSSGRGFSRLILVLSVFVGCWMPFSLWGLLGDASSPPLYTYATLVPAAGSSLLNPILYSLRHKDIRKVLLQACCPNRYTHNSHTHYPVDV